MWTLYVVWSKKLNTAYIGITQDLGVRLKRHNSSKAGWTKRGQPWLLIYTEEHPNKSAAQKREYFLKSPGDGWKEKQLILHRGGVAQSVRAEDS